MTSLRTCLVSVCVLLSASAIGLPQAQAAPADAARPEPVVGHIPAGALGFVVVNNVKATTDKVDKFIAEIGLAQMLPSPDADNPDRKPPVLSLLKGLAQLGEGFNANGGLAVVMLDPKAYDLDLLEMFGMKPPANDAGAEPKAKPKVPFVILVPGKGIEDVFGAYKMEPAGKHMLIQLRMGPTYAAKVGGYIALSPNDKALDAVMAAKGEAVAGIPPEQVKALASADLAYHLNMKVTAPILSQFLQQMQQQIVMQAGPMGPLVGMYFGIYRDLIGQMETVTVAARLVPGGLVFDEMFSFVPDSTFGKALAAGKDQQGATLDALPNLKYVLALGAAGKADETSVKLGMDMVEKLIKSDLLKELPEEEKARIRKLVAGISEQITSTQMVLGGATPGTGLFGAAFVLKCKNAGAVKELLAEKAKLAQALVNHFADDAPDIKDLKIRYLKGMETVGSVTADAIIIEHPELLEMEENDRAQMKKALGEDQIRFFVAAADDKTVVVTFGGSKAFLGEALKTATGKGTIGAAAENAEAMKYLPKKRSMLMLINAANLYEIIVAGMKTMAPDQEAPPFKISCKTPIAVGGGVVGKSGHMVIYVPTQLIKEITGVVMMFAPVGGGGPGAGPATPDDL